MDRVSVDNQSIFVSIVWLRCFATIFITNSHFSILYPEQISFLSFGGFFGNSLFLLISGFCLAYPKQKFLPYHAKRISRIYLPYLLFLPILLLLGEIKEFNLIELIFPIGRYHFLPTIVTLYPLYYICSYLNNKTKFKFQYSLIVAFVIQLVYYIFLYDYSYSVVEHYKILPMATYFQLMLLGGILREKKVWKLNYSKKKISGVKIIILIGVVLTFCLYIFQSFKPFPQKFSILQLVIGLLFALFFSLLFLTNESSLKTNKLVSLLDDLTLEIYIVQFPIIKAFSHSNFPGGLILCTISIVATAYCLHIVSRWILKKIKR